jgi:hypothetical protein
MDQEHEDLAVDDAPADCSCGEDGHSDRSPAGLTG